MKLAEPTPPSSPAALRAGARPASDAPREAPRAGPPPDGKTIRVIEVRRTFVDPATATQEELELALEALLEVPALAGSGEALKAILPVARVLQGPLAPLLREFGRVAAAGTRHAEPPLDSILVRDLLACPAVLPVLAARGAAAMTDRPAEGHNIRTRAARRARAVTADGYDAALAAEEPAETAGFAVDPEAAGMAVLANLGSGAFLGLDVYASSGACPASVLAAVGPVRPPEFATPAGAGEEPARSPELTLLRSRGFVAALLAEPRRALPEALLRQASAAVEFYLSGAAAVTALARLAAAAAPAPVLSPAGGLIVSARPLPASARVTWRSPADDERLRYLAGRLARTEPVAAAAPGMWVYDLSPLNDLYRVGAFGVYYYALTEGRESQRLDDFLELSAIRQAKATQLEAVARRAVIASSRARQYITIIEDKFGSARVRAVLDALRTASGARARGAPGGSLAEVSDAVQVDDPDAVLALLSKREQEVVTTEFENRRLEWEATVNNKCPHVRVARRLRAATSAEAALAALQELSKYFAAPRARGEAAAARGEGHEWLLCQNCGFRALCPHVRDRVRLEGRRASYDEVRGRLLRYAVRVQGPQNRASDAEGDSHAYYCRVCSERLAEAAEEDRTAELLGRFGELDAGLRTKIWVAALAAARHVRFPTPTDERQFASTAAAAIYPLLMAAEEAVARKGRRRRAPRAEDDDGEVDPRTQLYVVLFVYAYILDLIRASRGTRHAEVGFAGVKPGAKEGAYAERMLRLVAEEHRGLLSQIEDVTAEFLRARFTESYRLVRGESGGPLRAANPEEELAVQTTTLDPVYRYGATAARVAGDLPLARPAGPAEARREFETVLGASLPHVVKQARESAKDPILAPLYLRRTGVEVPPGGALEFLVKDARVNLYAAIYEPRADTAGKDALSAFRGAAAAAALPALGIRTWLGAAEPGLTGGARSGAKPGTRLAVHPEAPHALAERGYFFEAYRLFVAYTKDITSQEAYDAYQADLAAVRVCEGGLRVARALDALKPYYDFGFRASQQYLPAEVPITALYDEDGRPHDWTKKATYYYARRGAAEGSPGAVRVEGGPAGVKKARDSGALAPDMILADVQCPVCGARASRLGELDAGKARLSVRAASEIDSFFVFYESRCPAGELHEWDSAAQPRGGPACRKCGLAAALIKEIVGGFAARNKAARAYYDQHSARFAEERRLAHEKITGPRAALPPAAVPPLAQSAAASWEPDYTLVVRAAALAGVVPAVVEAIGSMEGRDYEDIVEGRGVPPLASSPADPRIYAIDAEARYFLSEYSLLRHVLRVAKPPPDLVELLAAAGAPRHEWGALPQALPDVGAGYREAFAAVLRDRSPADAQTFALQSLCRFALEIAAVAGGPQAWAPRLAEAFARRTLLLVLRGQKLFAKPGSFNWAVFEVGDEGVQDQVGDVGEDVLEELLGGEGEEAPDDPFSGENMDYDTGEDNPNNEAA